MEQTKHNYNKHNCYKFKVWFLKFNNQERKDEVSIVKYQLSAAQTK